MATNTVMTTVTSTTMSTKTSMEAVTMVKRSW
jgi:hypothetical protein